MKTMQEGPQPTRIHWQPRRRASIHRWAMFLANMGTIYVVIVHALDVIGRHV